MENQKRIPKRRSQDLSEKVVQSEKNQLIEEILKMQDQLEKLTNKLEEQHHRKNKILESNARNEKRQLRYRARIQQMSRHKNNPGHMNQAIQGYIFAHNFQFNVNPQQAQGLDPDNMSYEQLIELGDRIGKVSKGLSKEDIQKLNHKHHKRIKGVEERCPICQNQLEQDQVIIELRCKHTYHQECILFWLKDENTCPLCKEYLPEKGKEEQKMDKFSLL